MTGTVIAAYLGGVICCAVALAWGLYRPAEQQQRWSRYWFAVTAWGLMWPVTIAAALAWKSERGRRFLRSLADPPSTGGGRMTGWRRSSFCHSGGCVHVRPTPDGVEVAQDPERGPWLAFTDDEWATFCDGVRAGEFDRDALTGGGS